MQSRREMLMQEIAFIPQMSDITLDSYHTELLLSFAISEIMDDQEIIEENVLILDAVKAEKQRRKQMKFKPTDADFKKLYQDCVAGIN